MPYSAPAPVGFNPIGAKPLPVDAANSMVSAYKTYNQDEQAQMFQKHLEKGLAGMQEVLNQLPPEVVQQVGDPTPYAGSDEKRAIWYMGVNQAINRANMQSAATQGNTAEVGRLGLNNPNATPEDATKVSEANQLRQLGPSLNLMQAPIPAADNTATPEATDLIPAKKIEGSGVQRRLRLAQKYFPAVEGAATKNKVDPMLMKALMLTEADENVSPDSRNSKSSAEGLFQIIDSTAKDLKLDDRTDPQQSANGASKYMAQLITMFGGDSEKAVVAYHDGPQAVADYIKKYGEADWKKGVSSEGKEHLSRVKGYMNVMGGGAPQATSAAAPAQPKAMSAAEVMQQIVAKDPNLMANPAVKEILTKIGTENQAESLRLRQEQLDLNKSAEGRRNKALDYRQEEDLNKNIQQYIKTVKDAPVLGQDINELDDLVDLDSAKPIVGVGWGERPFRDFMLATNPESASIRKLTASIFTHLGHDISGANFTSQEMKNLESMLGTSFFDTEESFRIAMRRLRAETKLRLRSAAAGLGEKGKAEAEKRGAFTDNNMEKGAPRESTTKAQTKDKHKSLATKYGLD